MNNWSIAQKIAYANGTQKSRKNTSHPAGSKCFKDENNINAKYWVLKSPNQQIVEGWNLNEIVRKNEHLFDKDDVSWFGESNNQCRAAKGLRGLFEMKKDGSGPKNLSWKGWMIGDRREAIANAKGYAA